MIKLKSLILENKRSDPIELDTVQKAISGNFRYAFLQGIQEKFLWRGIRSGTPYMYIEPQKHTRIARSDMSLGPIGTNNLLNSLIDLLPSWENWPKRSKSVIFVNALKSASDYGKLYIVLPHNNSRVAVCPSNDFFHSFPVIHSRYGIIENVFQFNHFWFKLLYPEDGSYTTDITPESLKKTFSEYDGFGKDVTLNIMRKSKKTISNDPMSWYFSKQAEKVEKDFREHYNGNFIKYFDDILNPEDNKFELKTLKEIYDKYTIKEQNIFTQEMFTDSPCVLVSQILWPKQMQQLK